MRASRRGSARSRRGVKLGRVDVSFPPRHAGSPGRPRSFLGKPRQVSYCSCMRWRLASTEYRRDTKPQRVAALESLARRGVPIGVLAYVDGAPVGWCSIAPRETYVALGRYKAPRADRRRAGLVGRLLLRGPSRATGGPGRAACSAPPWPTRRRWARNRGGLSVSPARASTRTWARRRLFRAAGFRDVTPPGRERRSSATRCRAHEEAPCGHRAATQLDQRRCSRGSGSSRCRPTGR